MKVAIVSFDVGQAQDIEDDLFESGCDCYIYWGWRSFISNYPNRILDVLIITRGFLGVEDCEVMDWLRREGPVSTIVITNQQNDDDVIAWLNAGASDIITTPVSARSVGARVKSLAKRLAPTTQACDYSFGNYTFHHSRRCVLIDGKAIPLTEKEFMLGLLLFRNSNSPISRRSIYESIWKYKSTAASRTVDTHISRIRRKMRLFPGSEFPLVSIYGEGYMIIQKNETIPPAQADQRARPHLS